MTNHMTNAQAFDRAFSPNYQGAAAEILDTYAEREPTVVNGFLVQMLAPGIAHVTDGDVTLAVMDHYCAHCRDDEHDGEAMCVHKEAMFEAEHPDDAADLVATYEAALDVGVQ